MSQSSQEKSERATPRKLREARKRGQVARSSSLSGAAVLTAVALAATALGGRAFEGLHDAFRVGLEAAARGGAGGDPVEVLGHVLRIALEAVAPLPALCLVVAFLAAALQVGPLLTLPSMIPKLERLNPITGLRQRVLSLRALVELARSLLVLVVAGAVVSGLVESAMPEILVSVRSPATELTDGIGRLVRRCLAAVAAIYLVVAVADLLYQRWQYARDQRMTREEVKREQKDDSGDPQHNAARDQARREMLQRSAIDRTRGAHAVLRNPTHIACALRFDPETDPAPLLLCKGEGWVAQEMERVARDEGIPVIRDVPLARALHALPEDLLVPEELFVAVAAVLRWIADEARARGESAPWDHLLEPVESDVRDGLGVPAGLHAPGTPALQIPCVLNARRATNDDERG